MEEMTACDIAGGGGQGADNAEFFFWGYEVQES